MDLDLDHVRSLLTALIDADGEPYAASDILESLASLGQSVIGNLLAIMDGNDQAYRAAAAKAVGYMPWFSENTLDVSATASRLQQMLDDENERVVFEAAKALWSLTNEFPWFDRSISETIIIDSLTADDAVVRAKAAERLARSGLPSDRLIWPLIQALDDPVPDVRFEVVRALMIRRSDAHDTLPSLRSLARSDDPLSRFAASSAVARLECDKRYLVRAIGAFDQLEMDQREKATYLLGHLDDFADELIRVFARQYFDSKDRDLRLASVSVISGFCRNQQRTFLVLFAAFHDEDMEVRQAAMLGLGALGVGDGYSEDMDIPKLEDLPFDLDDDI